MKRGKSTIKEKRKTPEEIKWGERLQEKFKEEGWWYLSLGPRAAVVGCPVRAGAGPVGAHVDAQPAVEPLAVDGVAELLLHHGAEVCEVVQGEGPGRG